MCQTRTLLNLSLMPSFAQVALPFYMLMAGSMIRSYYWPPKDLPILHGLLQVSSHLISDDIHLLGHD